MSIRQFFSDFFYRLLGCAKLVKNVQLVPYKYTNEHLVASYAKTSLAEKYGFIPPAHKADFGEIVDMLLVDDNVIQIIGKHFYENQAYIDPEHDYIPLNMFVDTNSKFDYIWYNGKCYEGKNMYTLYRWFQNEKLKDTLEAL